jgi:ClpP class serine protease
VLLNYTLKALTNEVRTMKVNTLINTLARGYFLVDRRYADRYLPFIADVFKGKQAFFFIDDEIAANEEKHLGYLLSPENDRFIKTREIDEAKENSVYVMTLAGAVMKEDNCGVPGTSTLMRNLREAMSHDKVGSAVFAVDTGGGSVDGTFEFADEIARLIAETGKPIIGYVDGMACSAGYALMAACSEIWTSHRTAEVGSIGVCLSFNDYSEYFKKAGVKLHYINATTSADKNQDYLTAKEGDYKLVQESLDKIHTIFKETVLSGRPDVSQSAMTGKVYLSEEALKLKLIDGISTLEDAVNRAYDLSINKPQ